MTLKKFAAIWCGAVFGCVAAGLVAAFLMFAVENPVEAMVGFFILTTLVALRILVGEAK